MENSFFTFTAKSPLPISANEILQDADPVIYHLLSFYKAVIQLHTQDRWNVEVAAAGLPDLINKTVGYSVPYDPVPFFQDTQFKFPLLAAYRQSEEYSERTTTQYQSVAKVQVLYVLPPFTAAQYERMAPFVTHVSRTLTNRTEQGFDSNYSDGYTSIWKLAKLAKIKMKGCTYGNIPSETNSFYPTVILNLEVTEQVSTDTRNFQDYDGSDGYISSSNNAIFDPLDFTTIIKGNQ